MTNYRKQIVKTSFCQNNFLLLQFILSEFLNVLHEINNFRFQKKNFIESFESTKEEAEKILSLKKLHSSIEQLSGASYNYMRILSWKQDYGLLNKLNHYCALFSQHPTKNVKEVQKAYQLAGEGWLISIGLHDLTFSLKTQSIDEWESSFKQISNFEDKIFKKTTQFSKLLPKIIQEYSENENVIFFILRHKKEFDNLIHPDFVHNLFSMHYNEGAADAEKMLLDKYSKRGFYQLLPIIMEKFRDI